MNSFFRLIVLCLLVSGSLFGCGNDSTSTGGACKSALGWVEFVTLKPSGIVAKAKLDTGAKTSSLQADNIEMFTRDGKQWVRFTYERKRRAAVHGMPAVPHQRQVIEAPLKRMVRIKQHTVDFVERPAIDMDIQIGDKTYTTEFTLTSRDAFIYPVLLGRRFLEDNGTVVDASHIHITGAPDDLTEAHGHGETAR